MIRVPPIKRSYLEARGVYASSFQSLKERAFPSLMSGHFANMTSLDMKKYAWMNISKEKALEVPSSQDYVCQRLGSEGCAFLNTLIGKEVDYNMEESTLFTYEHSNAAKYFSTEWLRPVYGLSEITNALETSAKRIGVKMYPREKVHALNRKGGMFEIRTDHFLATAKKLIIAVPVAPLNEITGDVALGIKNNSLFKPIIGQPCFKAVAIYKYPWWENATFSGHNMTLKPWEIYLSGATCLAWMMPYSGRGINGEAIIQVAYSYYGCAVKWGKLSKLPKAVFYSELKKSIQAVFPGMAVPDPLDIVFKYWENTCWHQTRAGSNVSRYDIEEWAKRPYPGEEVYIVGESFSVIDAYNEGALLTAYNALKEGWGIMQPEP